MFYTGYGPEHNHEHNEANKLLGVTVFSPEVSANKLEATHAPGGFEKPGYIGDTMALFLLSPWDHIGSQDRPPCMITVFESDEIVDSDQTVVVSSRHFTFSKHSQA